MGLDLGAEMPQRGEHRVGGRLPQSAQRAFPHRAGQLREQLQGLASARPSMMSSRRASICLVPSRHSTHLPHDSFCVNCMKKRATLTMQVCLVHHHQAAGADHGPHALQRVEIQRQVEMLLGQAAAGGPADLHRLEAIVGQLAARR